MKRLQAPAHLTAPTADIIASERRYHGKDLHDDYFWMKDDGYPKVTDKRVLASLEAENTYYSAVMGQHQDLTNQLFAELKGRLKEDDEGVPFVDGDYEYKWAFAKGAQYRMWYRRKKLSSDDFSLYFDETAEAAKAAETAEAGMEFFKLHDLSVSPCGQLLAWSADTNGSERFTIRVRNLITGEVLADEVEETSGEIVWASDSSGFAYVVVSKEWRPYRVQLHKLGSSEDALLFEEKDSSFFVHIEATSSQKWLAIRSGDHVTAENHMLPLADLTAAPICLAPRKAGHDYSVDHGWMNHDLDPTGAGLFIIRSNKRHSNFDLMVRPVDASDDQNQGQEWTPLVSGSKDRYIRGYQIFAGFIAIEQRMQGLDQVIIHGADGTAHEILFPEQTCECGLGANYEYDSTVVRVTFTSMISPNSVYDYDVNGMRLMQMKEQIIPSGYDKSAYRTSRVIITARDGEQVPVSLVHRHDWVQGQGPLHLYGYGAYGMGMTPSFSTARLSLLDRGFAYAIAHIRGGDEMGYDWYTAGKLDQRENSFNDFIDCARGLVKDGTVRAGQITISGGSAGGELMGAALNQDPDLFAGAVLHVPFVDVLNTMLDDSLPLTPIEWPEWGNPITSAADYDMIAAYCPYSNISAKAYPPQMITGGLNDPRVTYWEPAKWTAKMRATKTDDNLVVMKINMGAGHGGKSGRFERLTEVAEEYTFLLMSTGKA